MSDRDLLCCVDLRAWIGTQPSDFHCKEIMSYFGALEGRNIVTLCSSMPKLALTQPPDSEIKTAKNAVFVHCEGSCRVP